MRRRAGWAIGGASPIVFIGLIVVRGMTGRRVAPPARPLPDRVKLVPIELPGPWWRRHRRWLASPAPVAPRRHVVVNGRTGAAHAWAFKGTRGGRAWFGVSTRWAWLHPEWKGDPWVLLYDHTEA